jgi:hypothetical protein
MTLTEEQMRDLDALLSWAFVNRPGIPQTAVLNTLWRDLRGELLGIDNRAREVAA